MKEDCSYEEGTFGICTTSCSSFGSSSSEVGSIADQNVHLSHKPNKLFTRKSGNVWEVPLVVTEIQVWDASEDIRTVRDSVPIAACGCSVCPDDNNIVAAVCTFRHQLPNHRDNTFAVPSAGFVSLWALHCNRVYRNSDSSDTETSDDSSLSSSCSSFHDDFMSPKIKCFARNFTYSPLPSCKFSPNSELLTSIVNSGKGTLSVLGRQRSGDPFSYDVCKLRCDGIGGQNSLCGRTICAFFSRSGDYMATLSNVTLYSNRNIDVHELCMWSTRSICHFQNEWQLGLDTACPGFRGYICTGKFSPDGKYVGLSSTRGHLMLVETETGALATDIPGFLEDTDGGPCLFDFDPRFKHSVLSVGHWSGKVFILRLSKGNVQKLFEYYVEEGTKLCTLCYALDGLSLALGSSAGIISLIDTESGQVISKLDFMSDIHTPNRDASVMDIQYMFSCQELIAAYSDGIVRIWQLPRILDLQHICRLKIRSLIGAKLINDLPISESLIKFLLYAPVLL